MASIINGHPLQPEVDRLLLEGKSTRYISNYLKEHGVALSHNGVANYARSLKEDIHDEVARQVTEIRAAATEQQVTAQMFLQALVQKGYSKLLNGDYDNVSLKNVIAAARILVPTQINADVTTTITMEDVISALSEESDCLDSEQESNN